MAYIQNHVSENYEIVTADADGQHRSKDVEMVWKEAKNHPGEWYEYEMNALLVCYRKKISLREIGVETIYINDNAGSHFNPLRDSYRIYKEILRFSASSIISFFLDYGIYSLLLWLTAGFSKSISLFLSNVMARIFCLQHWRYPVSAFILLVYLSARIVKAFSDNYEKN